MKCRRKRCFLLDIGGRKTTFRKGEKEDMEIYVNELEKMLNELKILKRKYNKELSRSPQGSLHRIVRTIPAAHTPQTAGNGQLAACAGSVNAGSASGKNTENTMISYLWAVKNEDDRMLRKGVTKDTEFVRKMARKAYLKKALGIVERDIEVMERAVRCFVPVSPEDILNSIPSAYRDLPAEYFFNKNRTGGDWANSEYEQSNYMPENKVHLTSKGLYVRSKSEAIIAEELYKHKVPFHYEEVLKIGENIVIPDFTIKNHAGEICYWEHCGLTGDPEYMQRHNEKLRLYEEVGIVPWKNLIVTYDDEDGKINIAIVESEIANKLV